MHVLLLKRLKDFFKIIIINRNLFSILNIMLFDYHKYNCTFLVCKLFYTSPFNFDIYKKIKFWKNLHTYYTHIWISFGSNYINCIVSSSLDYSWFLKFKNIVLQFIWHILVTNCISRYIQLKIQTFRYRIFYIAIYSWTDRAWILRRIISNF